MQSEEFSKIRNVLGKTQKQLAQILCASPKAIQSFEQGWRNVPKHIEREMLLLLSLKTHFNEDTLSCWDIKNCPGEWRDNCIVWELKAGHLCWFLSGTFCQGSIHTNWDDKIKLCRKCEIYISIFE
ncbi:helix-turn-helix domain-containing protein [Chloroflexota bacterium]